eukprot:EG_transcript_15556
MVMELLELLQSLLLYLLLLAVVLRGLAWYFRTYQDSLLYFPLLPENATVCVSDPSEWGFQSWDELRIVTEDKTVLHGYFLKQEKDWTEAFTILYFHGNAGNIGHRIPLALALHRTAGCNAVMVEYRGYGLSGGRPSEAGLKQDARAALQHVHSLDINKKAVVVMGTSLGGAVALHLAATATHPVAGVIVENTFTSISAMVDVLWVEYVKPNVRPIVYQTLTPLALYCFKPIILHIDWNSLQVVPTIAIPILFLSGKRDELIPPAQMHRLYVSASRSPRKLFVSLPAGTHNDTWCSERYFDAVAAFLEHNVLQRPNPRVPPLAGNHTLDGDLV